MASRKKRLTAKQQRFVEEYLIDLNATNAAKRAGYSVKSAHSIGQENLTKPEVQEAIQKAMAKRSERTQITADRVLQELATIGFANMADYAEWGPNGVTLRESAELPRGATAAVIEVRERVNAQGDKTVSIKLAGKDPSLEKLAKHLGLYRDGAEIHTQGDVLVIKV